MIDTVAMSNSHRVRQSTVQWIEWVDGAFAEIVGIVPQLLCQLQTHHAFGLIRILAIPNVQLRPEVKDEHFILVENLHGQRLKAELIQRHENVVFHAVDTIQLGDVLLVELIVDHFIHRLVTVDFTM